jgi:hypothetical protein
MGRAWRSIADQASDSWRLSVALDVRRTTYAWTERPPPRNVPAKIVPRVSSLSRMVPCEPERQRAHRPVKCLYRCLRGE